MFNTLLFVGTTPDEPLYYVNSTRILARMGLSFYLTFTHSLKLVTSPQTMLMERFRVLPKECLLFLQKITGIPLSSSSPYIIYSSWGVGVEVGGYMMDGYETDSYEWPSMSLRYSLICTLTDILH